MIDEIVSKGEFARRCNVTPGRVSQWISEGKIGPDELVGEGRAAQIRVAAAREKLKIRIDSGQRNGHGLDTDLSSPPAPSKASQADDLDLSIKREKLAQVSAQNRRLAEEEKARKGIYVRASDVAADTSKLVGHILQMTEASLTEMANEVAAKFALPQRDVIHLLRHVFRAQRAKLSKQLAIEAEGSDKFIDDETG